MNHNDSSLYCVVKFLEFPFKDHYVCIPSSWVRVRRKSNHIVLVSYPDKHSKDTESRVKRRQVLSGAWRIYTADVKYSTDSYEDAQNFINGQYGEDEGDELSASESSNKNQLSPPHADVSVENSHKQDIPVEQSQNDHQIEETTDLEINTNNTSSDIQNSSNLTNQSETITIVNDNFLKKISMFNNDIAACFGDINQLNTSYKENPEKAKNKFKKFISLQTRNIERNIPTASTSKDTKAEVAKSSGKKRNKEKEQNHDGNGEDQVLNKKHCFDRKFDLPPEYDKNDTRWTLKYRTSAPGLVELMPGTDVYINAEKLSHCKSLAKDCKTLARSLLIEIFKTSALSTCSWTGARAQVDTLGAYVRPGLDENARKVMMAFVKHYGHKKLWETHTQSILNSIRDKMQKMRPKQK